MKTALRFLVLSFALMPGAAFAHTGASHAEGFVHGFLHPVGGIDHVLAMVAVGLFAAHLGGRALWLVPVTFLGVMALGGGFGLRGFALPYVEIGIALSVVVLGSMLAMRVKLPVAAAMTITGAFAVFHGFAHGAELPANASAFGYGAGFLLATGLLHAVGIAFAVGLAAPGRGDSGRRIVQSFGGAMTIAGIFLVATNL